MKKSPFKTLLSVVIVLIASFVVIGCATTPAARYYLLTSRETEAVADEAAQKTMVIGLGPVTFPGYLDRPQIVRHLSENRLFPDDVHHWAEPINENFARVLAENLSARFSGIRLLHFPWPGSMPPDCRIKIDVLRFDAGPDESVHLVADWSISGKNSFFRHSDISIPTSLQNFDLMVSTHSEALLILSREIGDALMAQVCL